ncbi:Lysosomal alpha-mannosidase [Blattella germanica]|nr:Lysosomal alpha-mannosidase [Blattella germanica]
MLYRRTRSDDGFGVGEALKEESYGLPLLVRGKHNLVVGNANSNNSGPAMAAVERDLALKKLLQPWLVFTKTTLNFDQWRSSHKMECAGLTRNLPSNIHILTLEPWKENELLLRLEHIMEKDEDPELSKPVNVNLQDLFNTFTITEIHETNLAGNQWKEDMDRLIWKTGTERMKSSKPLLKEPIVTLKPMDILTYVIKVQRKTTNPDYRPTVLRI